MKDFFDCYRLLTLHAIDDAQLTDAVFATFDNRKVSYNPDLQLFTDDFANDPNRLKQWYAFLKRIHWSDELSFNDVMQVVKNRLKPIYEKYCAETLN